MQTIGNKAEDRRANIRLHRVLVVEIEWQGEYLPTVAVDISISGFQIASPVAPQVGEDCSVRIYLRNGPSLQARAELVWRQDLGLGLFRLGFQFVEMSSPHDFERLCLYVEKERLNSDGIPETCVQTLELATQVTLRGLTDEEIDRFSVLAEVSELLNGCYQLNDILERALKITVEATGAERGMVLLEQGEEFVVPAFHSLTSDCNTNYSRSVVEAVRERGSALISLDAQCDERFSQSVSLKVMGTRSVMCLPIRDGGRTFGLLYLDCSVRSGAFTDTELKLAGVISRMAASAIVRAEEFSQMAQREKLASMGTLMAGVMHELRNPLAAISGIADVMGTGKIDEGLVQGLKEETERCGALIRDLLRLSRQEPAEFSPLRLENVLHTAATAVQTESARQNVKVLLEIESDLPLIYGNAGHLRQVALNLLSNAMFSAASAESGLVRATLGRDGKGVKFTVCDNGPGFATGMASKVFDPFFTTKSQEKGTGLGLSIAHRIVTEHRGTITAENSPHGGALFSVILPALAVPKEQAEAG
ncbi:MAG: ATP-binding protein [Vulcanimicrobiota bacterium]